MRTTLLALLLAGCGSSGNAPDDMATPDLAQADDLAAGPDLFVLQCKAQSLPGFASVYHPRRTTHAGLCTAAQITQASTTGNLSTFLGWKFTPGNTECGSCLLTADDATAWGPWIYRPETSNQGFYINNRGCQEVLTGDSGPASCGGLGQAQDECVFAACEPQCPNVNIAAGMALNNCLNAAAKGTCKPFNDALVACSDDADGGAMDFCYRNPTDQASLQAWFADVATLFCGP